MTLEGAKLICLDEEGNQGEIILAKGRKFTMGYYASCDFILVDERAKGVQCEIECDAFGRVTIRNLSPDKPILVNGSSVEIKRILLNNSKLSILNKEYLWIFSKISSNEFEDLPASTPLKQIGIPEQPPNSCPDFKLHRDLPKRFTVHNFVYCIQSDEEGNISSESNDESTNADLKADRNENEIQNKNSNGNTSQNVELDKMKENLSRSATPEPVNSLAKSTSEVLETPKMNVINCSKDKENTSTQRKNKQLLKSCHLSDVIITSFSPRETGVKIEKSFATIIKPKVIVTKPHSTPKSVYSTPKSDMNESDQCDESERELINFHTPSTSKKGMGMSTAFEKKLKNSSMHLIDLTTPSKLRPASPYLKSVLKPSVKKNIIQTIDKSCIQISSDEKLGVKPLPDTPATSEINSSSLQTPSVISVNSSTDISSVIEVTCDASDMGISSASAAGLNTPLKAQTRAGVCTPKKTPHSLMKRALLTSAKQKNTTPQLNTQNSTTPRREFINRIPLRSNLALLRTPVTPQTSIGDLSSSQLPRRQSMSTPTRKNISATARFNNSPSTCNLNSASPSTSCKMTSRRSSLLPLSSARVLPTSTPFSTSRNKSCLRTRAACKTSPLHKVRKSSGGVPLSSHISKARRSIILQASNSKIISVKEKTPQQVMSDRLVARARNSLCVTPISARSSASAKMPPQSTIQSAKKSGRKAVLSANKQPVDGSDIDNLSRTFIIDSDEDEKVDNKKRQKMPKDATFSPEKDSNEMDKSTKKQDIEEINKEQQAIEIPVDVEEVAGATKDNKECEDKNKKNNEVKNNLEKQSTVVKTEHKNNTPLPVTEENFAEILNDLHEQHNLIDTIKIVDSVKETVKKVSVEENSSDKRDDLVKTTNQDNNETNVLEIGFGEESITEIPQTPNNENVRYKVSGNVNDALHNRDNYKKPSLQDTDATTSQCGQKDIMEVDINNPVNETVLIEKTVGEIKCTDDQEVELKCEEQTCEYKPIVEDITLEGSLIEKEEKENEIIASRQLLYEHVNVEGFLIEEKVKGEKIKEETTEIIIKESTDKEQLRATTSIVSEICEPSEKLQQLNMEHTDRDNQQTKEISTNIQEIKQTLTNQIEKIESSDTNRTEMMESLEFNQVDENNKISETAEPLQFIQSEATDTYSLYLDNFDKNGGETTNKTEIKEKLQVLQNEASGSYHQVKAKTFDKNEDETAKILKRADDFKAFELDSQSAVMDEERIDDELEDTNKLLEEIEDVLNKSDEIKQKHLNELEECSDKPLTEEFESEKLSEESAAEVEEESESEKHMINETSDIESSVELNKLTKQEDTNIDGTPSQQQEKCVENAEEIDGETTEENFVAENPNKNQTIIGSEKNSECKDQEFKSSDNTVLQLKDNTSYNENTKLFSQEMSETLETVKVLKNEDNSKSIEGNIISNNEVFDLYVQEKPETKTIENVAKNDQNIEKFETLSVENIACELEIADSSKQVNSPLITQEQENHSLNKKIADNVPNQCDDKEDNSTNDENNEISSQVKSIDQNIDGKDFGIRSEKESNSNQIENVKNLKQGEENISDIEIFTELNTVTKKVENATSFTPRRSTRRVSQSTDTPELSDQLTFTPRRSARRASMSAESAITCTTTKITTRRASLSLNSETPLTPKRITKRRSSISMADETEKPSTSKLQRAKTPRKQFERSMVIPEEIDEVVSSAQEKVQFEENKCQRSIVHDDATPKISAILTQIPTTPRKQLEQDMIIPEEMDMDVIVISSEEFEPETEQNKEQNLEKDSQTDLSENPTEVPENWQEKQNVAGETLESHKNISTSEEKLEMLEQSSQDLISNEKKVLVLSSSDNTVTDNANSEQPQHDNEGNNSVTTIEESVDFINVQGLTNINLPKSADRIMPKEFNKSSAQQNEVVDKEPLQEVIPKTTEDHNIALKKSTEYYKDKEMSSSSKETNSPKTSRAANVNLPIEKSTVAEQKEISTPAVKRSIKILDDNPKTPLMSGMRELLKTPKADVSTPRLEGIRDLVRTPKDTRESEEEEFEKLSVVADLVRTPETQISAADFSKTPLMTGIRELLKTPKPVAQTPRLGGIRDLLLTPKESLENEHEDLENFAVVADLVKTPEVNISKSSTPKSKKHATIVAESPKTPLRTGMRVLLKTPNSEIGTSKFAGLRNLLQTPEPNLENDQEEIEQLSVATKLIETPEDFKNRRNIEEMPSSSMKNELLKTPKSCAIPRIGGKRELMQTPKVSSTTLTSDVKDLMESPTPQEAQNLKISTAEMTENVVAKQSSQESTSTGTKNEFSNLKGVRELLKTPRTYSSPRFKGLKELMQTPKMSSTPILGGIKELMDTPAQQKGQELEKFLRTPAAKNIMIPSMPSSAIIEKNSDSIEVSTEYDLNSTNDDESTNLEELFKTPMGSRFGERITGSYYGDEVDEPEETDEQLSTTTHESLQDVLNKSAEDAFDELVGQSTQIQTPIHKIYTRKSFTLQTPQSRSPFTAADVLSDLPKTDVEEWIETLDQAMPPTIIDCDDSEEEEDEDEQEVVEHDIINESAEMSSILHSLNEQDEQNLSMSFNESIIPETCTKMYLTENTFRNKTISASLTCTLTKDPLSNTEKKIKDKASSSLVATADAEISGINLLDQTVESLQDESSMLDEPLVVEEPSMFEEPLIVSDNESETEGNTLNYDDNPEVSQDEGNDLFEPLLVSDSDSLNQTQETESNEMFKTENVLEITKQQDEVLQTVSLDINVQEQSMLEKLPNINHSMSEDPLGTEYEEGNTEDNTVIEIDVSQSGDKITHKDDDENSSICQIEQTESAATCHPIINLTIENIDAEIDAVETAADSEAYENVEHEDCKEIAIEQTTRVISIDSEEMFEDTSVTEICKETSILQQEQEEHKENISSAKNTKTTNDECQDIFMDNSNIDKSFAEENEAALSGVVTKRVLDNNPENLSLTLEADNNDTLISETKTADSNKLVENIREKSGADVENVLDIESENNTNETSAVEKNPAENKSVETSETSNLKYSVEKLVVAESSETLETQQESIDEKQFETQSSTTTAIEVEPSDAVNKVGETSKRYTTQDTVLSNENSMENEEALSVVSPVAIEIFSSTSQSLIESADSNEIITISECEMPEKEISNISPKQIADDVVHEPVKDPSTEFASSEVVTDKCASKPIELCEETALESKHDKSANEAKLQNHKPSGSILIEISESKEVENSEINTYEKLIDESKESSISKDNTEHKIAEAVLTKDLEKPETYLNKSLEEELPKSTTQENIRVEESARSLTPSSDIVKYDFEIKIIDADSETENGLNKDAAMKLPTSSQSSKKTHANMELPAIRQIEEVTSEIKSNSKEESATDLKSSFVKTSQVPQDVKTENTEKNSAEDTEEVAKVFDEKSEIKESKINKDKAVPKKSTVSDNTQESAQGDEVSTSSRRDRRKIIKKTISVENPAEEAEEEIKDTIPDIIKENEKPKRKHTTSESSQGSVKDDENYTRTRRGGRRKVQKAVLELTVEEQNEECEELILQQLKHEEPKTEEAKKLIILTENLPEEIAETNKQISKTEETPENQQNILRKNVTKINQQISPTEETNEKKESTQKESLAKSIHEGEKQSAEENETAEVLSEKCEQVLAKEKQNEETGEIDEIQKQVASTEGAHPQEKIYNIAQVFISASGNKVETEEHLTSIQGGQVTLSENTTLSDSIAKIHDQKEEKQVVETTNPEDPSTVKQEQQKSDVSKEKSDEVSLPEVSLSSVVKHDVEENPANEEIKLEELEVDARGVKENLRIVDKVSIFTEKPKHQIAKRGRRKPTASESSQDSVLEDDKPSAKMTRRKVQKTLIEEKLVEESEGNEEAATTSTSTKADEMNLESEEIPIQTKVSNVAIEHIDSKDDEIVEVPSVSYEVQQQTQKRVRRKVTASESSQGSVHEDDTSCTRKGRRKAQKTPIQEIVLEEEQTSESVIMAATEESKQDLTSKMNETEEISNNKAEENVNSDVVITEVPKVEINETVLDVKHDEVPKEITARRGRNKRILQDAVLEDPTTSRKSRRKVQAAKAEVSNVKLKPKTESDVNEVPIEITATDKQEKEVENTTAMQTVNLGGLKKINSNEISPEKVESNIDLPSSQQQRDTTQESPVVLSALEQTEQEIHEVEHSSKQTAKRGRPIKNKPARNKTAKADDSHKEDAELKQIPKTTSPQTQKTENIPSHDEEPEIEKEFAESPQKSTRRRVAIKYEQDDNHQGELLIKTRKRRAAYDKSENVLEAKKATEDSLIKVTVVNLEAEPSLDHHTLPQEENQGIKVRKGRKKATVEDNQPDDHKILAASKTRTVAKHIDQDHDKSGPSIRARVGRKKQIEENPVAYADTTATTSKSHGIGKRKLEKEKEDHLSMTNKEENTETISENKQNQTETNIDKPDTKEVLKHTESGETSNRKTPEHKDDDEKQITEKNIENSADMINEKKHDLKGDHDDHNVGGENQQPKPEGTKKGRGKKTKNDHQKEVEVATTSNSPETKHRGRKHNESQSQTGTHDHTTKEEDQSDEKLIKEPKIIPSTNIEHKTTQRTAAPGARKVHKAFEHITAESEEAEDTPGRRARNVPQRRAATAYHNYDETSDSEVLTKSKKKTDSPRKSLEAVKKLATATVTSSTILPISASPAYTALTTTARGRTRKPTAKVQQFLEKERAKAETPKKRALLAAVTVADATTPQRTPARRGRKPSTMESIVDGTPQAGKSRGTERPPASAQSKEETSVVPETIAVVEEKQTELQTTPPSSNTVKGRRGGRKAKIAEEENHNSDEPPVKKSPLELESGKQEATPSAATPAPTPTRVAGRRNAAAAAKARIEEDALAAAAIDPPKRARAKKVSPKASTHVVATTDANAHSSEAEQEQPKQTQAEDVKDKNSSQKREHRLTSASTIEGIDDLQNEIDIEAVDKPVNKRRRKAAAAATTTDLPAVPAKRVRKPKIVQEAADPETPEESKTSRGRGRGRKNVHFDEHHEAEATSSSQQNANDVEPVPVEAPETTKRGTRTRRK